MNEHYAFLITSAALCAFVLVWFVGWINAPHPEAVKQMRKANAETFGHYCTLVALTEEQIEKLRPPRPKQYGLDLKPIEAPPKADLERFYKLNRDLAEYKARRHQYLLLTIA